MTQETARNDSVFCWNAVGIWGDNSCERLSAEGHCRNCDVFSREGRRMLDRPYPQDYPLDTAKLLSGRKDTGKAPDLACVLFRLGGEWFVLPASFCRSVCAAKSHHNLPGRTNRVFRGLVNVDGELLPLTRGEALLGIEWKESGERAKEERMVVLEKKGVKSAVSVAEVFGVIGIATGEIAPPPDTLSRSAGGAVKGLVPTPFGKAGLLDGEALLASIDRSLRS